MHPVIESLEIHGRFNFLWLKYVTGVNLNLHCAKCLKGEYSSAINPAAGNVYGHILDEHEAHYYYLCGVSKPYKWANNFHLAFKYQPGSVIRVNRCGISVVIRDAEEIIIKPVPADFEHRYKDNPGYFTCRNWQFAVMLSQPPDYKG